MDPVDLVLDVFSDDKWRLGALNLVAELELPDGWIGAGFVRNAVWDRLHDRPMTPLSDIDVLYCDPERTDANIDEHDDTKYEEVLKEDNPPPQSSTQDPI